MAPGAGIAIQNTSIVVAVVRRQKSSDNCTPEKLLRIRFMCAHIFADRGARARTPNYYCCELGGVYVPFSTYVMARHSRVHKSMRALAARADADAVASQPFMGSYNIYVHDGVFALALRDVLGAHDQTKTNNKSIQLSHNF